MTNSEPFFVVDNINHGVESDSKVPLMQEKESLFEKSAPILSPTMAIVLGLLNLAPGSDYNAYFSLIRKHFRARYISSCTNYTLWKALLFLFTIQGLHCWSACCSPTAGNISISNWLVLEHHVRNKN